MDEVVIDRALLKAIGAESRILILKALVGRRKTQSELAGELRLSSPTIIEHLEQLVAAGLVDKIDEGRKWKYYSLTEKGRKLVAPKPGVPTHAIVLLTVGVIFMICSLFLLTGGMPVADSNQKVFGSENGAPQALAAAAAPGPQAEAATNTTTASALANSRGGREDQTWLYGGLVFGAISCAAGVYSLWRGRKANH